MFKDLTVEILGDLIVTSGRHVLTYLFGTNWPRTLRAHFDDLRSSLRKMPFIYKDLSGQVMNDFVQIRIQTIDLSTLVPRSSEKGGISTEERIRTRRKALFLGNAGIGKTTFFRHTVLSLISRKSESEHFFPDEKPIPFYVPLKAVENAGSAPILRHMLRTNVYLAGAKGLQRMERLGRQGKVFLLLDGYDEIYVPPSDQRNYILEELNILFDTPAKRKWDGISEEFKKIYEVLANCRVWLSSRREFFEHHRLELDEELAKRRRLNFVALLIEGLGDRYSLVNKLFDLYRDREESFAEKLSEEAFLHEIDLSGDDELIDLSYNPLFLTVMCYIHVQGVDNAEISNGEERAYANMSELILICVDLLLEDIDKYRVRDLRGAERLAFNKRRNIYGEEKRKFLAFFANLLIGRGQPVFTEADLIDAAKIFFRSEVKGPRAAEIIKGLESKRQSGHSFIRQLINQGIFVIVEKVEGQVFFDFPHRRFREVLAAKYLDTAEGLREVLGNIGSRHYSEFLYVFFAVSGFQDQILRAILKRVDESEQGRYYGTLLYNCLERRPSTYDPTPLLLDFFRDRMDKGKGFLMPRTTIRHLFADRDSVRWLSDVFRASFESESGHRMAIAGPIILEMNEELAREIFLSSFEKVHSLAVLGTALKIGGLIGYSVLLANLARFRVDSYHLRLWSYVVVGLSDEIRDDEFWIRVFHELSVRECSVVLEAVQTFNPSLAARIERDERLAANAELISALIRFIRFPKSRVQNRPKKSGGVAFEPSSSDSVYVITRHTVKSISREFFRDRFKDLLGSAFLDLNFMDEALPEETKNEVIENSKYDRKLLTEVRSALWHPPLVYVPHLLEYFV